MADAGWQYGGIIIMQAIASGTDPWIVVLCTPQSRFDLPMKVTVDDAPVEFSGFFTMKAERDIAAGEQVGGRHNFTFIGKPLLHNAPVRLYCMTTATKT
jgi:hypothetical protein